ncbi:MAG: cohesin domain-containing protein [Terracidiphilus sp.]|jgi:general secretion pathway protein D
MKSRAAAPAPCKAAYWIALFALLTVAGLSSVRLQAESAGSLFKRGESAEAREDYDAAFDLYQKAYAKAPRDITYRTALYRVRVTDSAMHLSKGHKLLVAGDEQGALVELLHAAEIDPGNEAAQQEIARVRKRHGEVMPQGETSLPLEPGKQEELDSMGAPPQLKPLSNEPLTLHMSEDTKVIYQAVGRAAGVNILFDPDYNSKRIQVDLNNVSLLDALRIVGTMSNTFWRPVTENTIFVAQNTRAKRTDLDEAAVETFYLTNAWQQNDLNDVQTAIRNVLTGIKIYGVPSQNAIVIRGTPDELLLAQKLINDLDRARAEVVVDIAVLEVSKNWERTLGIAWPSSVGMALQPPTSSTTTTTTPTTGTTPTTNTGSTPSLYDLAHLKATDFAVTIGSATANLLLTDSNTKVLQNPRIRATDAQKATMKIGSRIPIATGSYQTGAATAVVSSLVNTQFQYQDVGVNIEMTPSVHYDHDVTLKIKIEVTSQSGSVTISGVTEPILSQRVVDQTIRLREGEASVLGGIQDKQDEVSWTGIPGLSSIPILRYLFGSKDHTITDDELVFLVVPHIVRTQTLDRVNLRTIDTGVGTAIELRHVSAAVPAGSNPPTNPGSTPPSTQGPNPAPAAPPAVRPPAPPHSDIGVVPGQSAMAAAPAALAQLSASADANGQTAAAAVAGHPPGMPVPPVPESVNPGSVPPGSVKPGVVSPGSVNLMFSPLGGPVAAGATFQVSVVLTGGKDIASVPLQVQYDPAKLSLVNVTSGDLLGRDGQAVALVHRDDGPGSITINAARPPGAAGVNGAGVVCVLSFQARAAGESVLAMTRAAAVNSAQQQVPAQGAQVNIVVK